MMDFIVFFPPIKTQQILRQCLSNKDTKTSTKEVRIQLAFIQSNNNS